MPYRDSWATCGQCGKQFIFRIEEQRRLGAQGQEVVPPDVCPVCRGVARTQPGPRPAARPAPPTRPRREPSSVAAPRRREAPRRIERVPLGHGPHEGEVKWFSIEKGYGFLLHSSGQEVFVHRSGIAPGEAEHLLDGTRVTFLVEETERGPQAVDVERLN
jgi:CspA family cold shock protein